MSITCFEYSSCSYLEWDTGQIAKDVVRRDHFGGFSDDEPHDEDEV